MTLYEKIQAVKSDLISAKIKETGVKKGGYNKDGKPTSSYTYFELKDFIPPIVASCHKHKLCTLVNFSSTSASLRLIDSETNDEEVITIPLPKITIPGANELQAFGGAQTYARRYLYMAAFDITENDTVNQYDYNSTTDNSDEPKKCYCDKCNEEFKPYVTKNGKVVTSEQMYNAIKKDTADGIVRCKKCREIEVQLEPAEEIISDDDFGDFDEI